MSTGAKPEARLQAAIIAESAAIAPQTSELIEAAKEALGEIERLRAKLAEIHDITQDPWGGPIWGKIENIAATARAALSD